MPIVIPKRILRKRKMYQFIIKPFDGSVVKVDTTALCRQEALWRAAKLVNWYTKDQSDESSVSLSVKIKCMGLVARKPNRTKEVIAAAKKAKAAAAATAAQNMTQWQKTMKAENEAEDKARQENRRKRIGNQFAHAFSQVKLNAVNNKTVPIDAWKYVTCSYCDRPATHLILVRSIEKGATQVPVESIVDTACSHDKCYRLQQALSSKKPYVKCDELDFFMPDLLQTPVICVKGFKAAPVAAPAVSAVQ